MKGIEHFLNRPENLRGISKHLASKLNHLNIDFVAANTPEGMIPGWELREQLEKSQGKTPYVYVREKKKKGGHKEKITGDNRFNILNEEEKAVIVELEQDDSKFLERTLKSVKALENQGYKVKKAVSPTKRNKETERKLKTKGIELLHPENEEQTIETQENQEPNYPEEDSKEISRTILETGALEIRDLEAGEEPFLYSSGLWGPGYLMVKGLVSQPNTMKKLCWNLALKLQDKDFDFVIGNVTGGVIPGWQLRNYLEVLKEEHVPYIYAEGTRLLEDGLVEGKLVGNKTNPNIEKGDKALVVEELVNTAGTTTGSAIHAENKGYQVENAATILTYNNPLAKERLEEQGVELTHLTTLPDTLDLAEDEELVKPRAVKDYRFFMNNPKEYQEKWNLEPVKEGGTR